MSGGVYIDGERVGDVVSVEIERPKPRQIDLLAAVEYPDDPGRRIPLSGVKLWSISFTLPMARFSLEFQLSMLLAAGRIGRG